MHFTTLKKILVISMPALCPTLWPYLHAAEALVTILAGRQGPFPDQSEVMSNREPSHQPLIEQGHTERPVSVIKQISTDTEFPLYFLLRISPGSLFYTLLCTQCTGILAYVDMDFETSSISKLPDSISASCQATFHRVVWLYLKHRA